MQSVDLSNRLAFIGCGTMGSAIIRGILDHELFPARNIFAYDPNAQAVRRLPGVQLCGTAFEAVYNAGTVFVCVKPQDVRAAFTGANLENKAVVSLAAGIPMDYLRTALTGCERVMRIMSNICLKVDQAATAYTVPNTLTPVECERVLNIFRTLGTVEAVEEKHMDIVTALSGSGPAYFVLFIHQLSQAAAEAGLPYESALRLATQTALGTSELIRKDDRSPNEIIQSVCSAKGTTGAAMEVLEKPQFRKMVVGAIQAATRRAEELGSEFRE